MSSIRVFLQRVLFTDLLQPASPSGPAVEEVEFISNVSRRQSDPLHIIDPFKWHSEGQDKDVALVVMKGRAGRGGGMSTLGLMY